MFDFPGKNWFLGLFLISAMTVAWVYAAGHTIENASIFAFALSFLKGIFVVSILQYKEVAFKEIAQNLRWKTKPFFNSAQIEKGYLQIKICAQGLFFITMGWFCLRLFNHISMSIPFPYVDAMLWQWDNALGMDWNAYFKYVAERPALRQLLDICYSSLSPVSIFGFLLLLASNRALQAKYFVLVFTSTAIFCTFFGMFFPAIGTVTFGLDNKAYMELFPYPPGVYFVDIIANLRSAEAHVFNLFFLPGLTTFPSFHTASGIILVAAFRGSPLFIPMCIYCIYMIAATPIFGGHYFVDLIAGTLAAIGFCIYFERKEEFKGIFKTKSDKSVVLSLLNRG